MAMQQALRGVFRERSGSEPGSGIAYWMSAGGATTQNDSERLSMASAAYRGTPGSVVQDDGVAAAVYGEFFDGAAGRTVAAMSLAALYRDAGDGAWPLLNGSFAAALCDARGETAFVVTDRFGSIPVYYCAEGDTLVFSTCADEAARLASRPRFNAAALGSFLAYQRLFGCETYYDNVKALPPGSYLRFDRDGARVIRYFEPRYRAERRSLDEWTETLAETWRHAVEARTADNPIMLMSGGLDSRAVLAARPELPSVIFADYENHEVAVARKAAALAGSRLDVLIRRPEHYEAGLEAGVAAGGGMHPAHMGHVAGFEEALLARGPAAIHGNPPEAYFRNSSLYDAAIPQPPAGTAMRDHLLGLFKDHGKYVLGADAARSLLRGEAAARFAEVDETIRRTYDEAEDACESIQDMYTWLDTRHMNRYPSYVFELALAAIMPKRTPMWDNALYDLHLAMPWEVRTGDALWTAMIHRLNPALAALPSANVRLVTMHRLPLWAQSGILHVLGLARRTGMLPSGMPADPAHTMGSWPNFDELLRRSEGMRNLAESTLFGESLPADHIDMDAVRRLWSEHLAGRRNAAAAIFTLVTFGLWRRRSPFGEGA